MNKNVAAVIVGSLTAIVFTHVYSKVAEKGHGRGMCDFYEEKLGEAYEIIASKDKRISDYQDLLKRSTGQTERLITMIKDLGS